MAEAEVQLLNVLNIEQANNNIHSTSQGKF